MYITEYLTNEVSEKLGGDVSRFDELWALIPSFGEKLHRCTLMPNLLMLEQKNNISLITPLHGITLTG